MFSRVWGGSAGVQRAAPTAGGVVLRLAARMLASASPRMEVLQARTVGPEFLGTGTGDAGQTLAFSRAPVLPDSAQVQVEEDGGGVRAGGGVHEHPS